MRFQIILSVIFVFLFCAFAAAGSIDGITIQTADGKIIPLQKEDLSGLKNKPLRNTKEKWDHKFNKDFLSFLKIDMEADQEVAGTCKVNEGPLRLTVYQITKGKNTPRFIRILSTKFYEGNNVAEYRTKIQDMEENVFLITAEKADSADELNSHLKYMSTRKGDVELEGYSTNWDLSKLKLKFAGKGEALNNDSFVKDADWLIEQLIDPQWIISISVAVKQP